MSDDQNKDRLWQKKLLPFMVLSLIGLTIFFIVASYFEFRNFKESLELSSKSDELIIAPEIPELFKDDKSATSDYIKWRTLVLLERDALNRRYNHSKTVILARMWTRYLGFLTGMILAIVGAIFVLGKLRESESKFDGEATQILKLSITSASPGLLLATLGTILILATIIISPDVNVEDGNLYLFPQDTMPSTQAKPDSIYLGNKQVSEEAKRQLKELLSNSNQNSKPENASK